MKFNRLFICSLCIQLSLFNERGWHLQSCMFNPPHPLCSRSLWWVCLWSQFVINVVLTPLNYFTFCHTGCHVIGYYMVDCLIINHTISTFLLLMIWTSNLAFCGDGDVYVSSFGVLNCPIGIFVAMVMYMFLLLVFWTVPLVSLWQWLCILSFSCF